MRKIDYTRKMCRGEPRGTLREPSVSIHNPEDIIGYVRSLARSAVEHAAVLPIDSANHVLGAEEISRGGTQSTPVPIPTLFRCVLKYDTASGFILVHNHPSGNATPSDADIDMTSKLVSAGKLMGLPLLDHMVFGRYGASKSIRRLRPSIFD